MRGGEIGFQLTGIVQIVPFSIQIRIADPVVEVLDGLLIAPEQFDPLCIAGAAVVIFGIEIIDWIRLYEIGVFFIIGLYTENAILRHLLIIDNIMRSLCKADIRGIEELAVLRFLIEGAVGYGHLGFRTVR